VFLILVAVGLMIYGVAAVHWLAWPTIAVVLILLAVHRRH
jgi:hypothetical protein